MESGHWFYAREQVSLDAAVSTYPGLRWPNPNSIHGLVSRKRMNCGSVLQVIRGGSETCLLGLMSRKGFHYTSNWTKIPLNFKIIGAAGGRAGPLLCMPPGGGGAWNGGISRTQSCHSLSPRSYSLHTCAPSNSVNSTPSMLPLTQVWTNSSVRCAFPVVQVGQYSLPLPNKMCQERKKKLQLNWPDDSAPPLHLQFTGHQ